MPRLINQQTVEVRENESVEIWTIGLNSVNRINARQRARAFARRKDPTIRNVVNPTIKTERSRQTTFSELFPETIQRKNYEVEILVVR